MEETIVNSDLYNNAHQCRKHTSERLISVTGRKPSRRDYYYKTSDLQPVEVKLDMSLLIESKVKNSKSFKFQILSKTLQDQPFFRFESDGAAHRNTGQGLPLLDQQVTTPHFNRYTQSGVNIAYKTDELKNEARAKALIEDINFSFAHFCFESNIRFPIDEVPELSTNNGELGFKVDSEDILSQVTFN